jgi:hypothetical protein
VVEASLFCFLVIVLVQAVVVSMLTELVERFAVMILLVAAAGLLIERVPVGFALGANLRLRQFYLPRKGTAKRNTALQHRSIDWSR